MSIKIGNVVLMTLFDTLSREMGEATLELCFEDLDLDETLESHFDTMCLWAVNEGLITVSNGEEVSGTNTEHSYLTLKNPCLTSLGIAVGAIAVNTMQGDIVLSTAMARNPGISNLIKADLPLHRSV
ncbi:hypothetical protein [Pseudosulfitobacter pseudonitzschiae]|uniref:hypothetical protein n=1 Tax=Pseudosulfitobacter pseudonitzschiae TaxID=1402135 RepID=UPI003B82715B